MHDPYYQDPTATLYAASPLDVLIEMPDKSVECIVTSPPPWIPPEHPARDNQPHQEHGHEPTSALYVAALRRVLAEAHRVLADEGTCWLITSDRYATHTGWDGPATGRHARQIRDQAISGRPITSLIGLPWQIAFAAQDDGWIIRNAIVWRHPTADTEYPTNRLITSYELIFLLTKQKRYHFDLDSIRQLLRGPEVADEAPTIDGTQAEARCPDASARCRLGKQDRSARRDGGMSADAAGNCRNHGSATLPSAHHDAAAYSTGKNPGDVWNLPKRPSWNTLPIEVPMRCIAAGCRPASTVLDMWTGIATTGLAARELGRTFVGIEAASSICEVAKERLSQQGRATGGSPR